MPPKIDAWLDLFVARVDGRYGPYITDGETNLSLRKGMTVEELKFDEAVSMLAEKAAMGPPKKKAAKKKSATKKAAPKKGVTKKPAAKKAAKKATKKAAKKATVDESDE